MAHRLFNGHAMWLRQHWAIIGNLSGTALGTQLKLVTSVIQHVPIVQATQFLIRLSRAIVYKRS